MVLVGIQIGAIVVTAWIGGVSDWHAGILAGWWIGAATVAYAAAEVVRLRSGPVAKLPQRRLYLPPTLLVPLTLLVIGAAATVRLGAESGWRWDAVLAIWLGVTVAAAAHAAVTGMVAYPAGTLADRVRVSGLVPIGLVLAAAVASGWLVDASGGHPGLTLLLLWGRVCALAVAPTVTATRRTPPRRAVITEAEPQGPRPA